MCRTKGSTNVQVLIYGIFLLGIHQEDLGCSSTTTANHYLEIAEVCLNLLVLIYGFLCIVYQVSHKRSYQSTGSYTWDFSFRNTSRREISDVPQPQQPITIWRVQKYAGRLNLLFLYMGFRVLSTRCHTKGVTNLQVLIYGY